MDNDEEVIRIDQLKHPECNYSISISKSCFDKDGSLVCETIKNITRLCPNSRPVNVYSKRSKTDSSVDDELDGLPFLGKPMDQFPDLKDIMRQLDRTPRSNPRQHEDTYADQEGTSNEFENGFQNIFRRFGFGGSGRKPGEGNNGGPTSSGNGPKLPPGRTSGPSEDI